MASMESTSHAPPPILGAKGQPAPPAAEEARAAVKDLAAAPQGEKKAMRVDHQLVMSEVQLLLAEKRTSFALLRTGLAVALVPVSVWTVLVATSGMWSLFDSWWLLAPLMLVAVGLFGLGIYLMVHAMQHLAHTDRVLMGLRRSDTLLEDLLIEHGRAHRAFAAWASRHRRD